MRIGVFFPTKEYAPLDEMEARFRAVADQGFSSVWLPQSAGFDALTVLAVAGSEVPRIELGTSVIPTYPRHPVALAAQALTVNAAVDGRLLLGLGLSHRGSIEGTYGMSYDKPARHMREYLAALVPLLEGGEVDVVRPEDHRPHEAHDARRRRARRCSWPRCSPACSSSRAASPGGTITWCTGPITLEEQIVPLITAAATAAGRPAPRVVVALPTIVTDDEADGRAKADEQLAGYGNIPVYRAVLDREGVGRTGRRVGRGRREVGDRAIAPPRRHRCHRLRRHPHRHDDDRRRTLDHLAGLKEH